jgi:hypothetical protein
MLTKDSYRIATNKLPFLVQLMPHQKAMVYEMVMAENNVRQNQSTRYAMMSDKPGAGKTFAILAFIYFSDKVVFGGKKHNVNLIVVPYNICTQWKQSIERIFGPSGKVLKYRVLTEYADMMRLYVEPEELLQYDILLTTSLYFDSLASTINSLKMRLKRVFFDEADTIKNLLQTPLDCQMTWFVSASMESLFGKGTSSVTIGKYNLDMDHLKKHDVRCDPDFVNDNIVLDAPMTYNIRFPNIYYKLLKDVVGVQFHDNIAAMDYRCLRSEFVNDISRIDSEYIAALYVLRDITARESHAQQQVALLQADYEILMKKEMFKKAEEIEHEIRRFNTIIQDCQRRRSIYKFFCSKYDITDAFEAKPHEGRKLEKLWDVIKDIISKNARAQCIIFTNYDYIYTLLMPYLDKATISYKYLDGGNITAMDNIIEAYKRREFNILLADSSMYSCGMNLENTNDIIFVHKMDAQREKQVIGRAHRYGREGALGVWHIDYEE